MTSRKENEEKGWLLTASLENWELAQAHGVFGTHGNRSFLHEIRKGDPFVAYVPKIGFVGCGKITSEYFVGTQQVWKDKAYSHRFQLSTPFLSGKVVPAPAVVDDLGFITDKKNWGAFFKAGIREIPIKDIVLIERRLTKAVAVLSQITESAKKTTLPSEIGTELHNRVAGLFEDLGFTIVDNNYYTAGPDITVLDPESNENSKIIIQCKNSKQSKVTFSNLDKHLNEYSGRLKTQEAAMAIIVVTGHELPKKVPGESSELCIDDVLNKYGVAIWTEETLKYYEDLIGKISHFARYQVLSDLGLKLRFDENKRVEAIKVEQNKCVMYATAIEPDWLLRSVSVARRIDAADGPKGYQRLLEKSRVVNSDKAASIANYIDTHPDWLFPNAIVLASHREVPLIHGDGQLDLEGRYGQFWVIDGQHRLFAFANAAARLKHTRLLCVILDVHSFGTEKDEEKELAQVFVTLNGRSKRVPKALLYELYRLLGSKDNPELEVVLNLAEDSFFEGEIRGYSDKVGSINLTSFADANGTSSLYRYFIGKNPKKAQSSIVDLSTRYILNGFKEVARIFPVEWGDPDNYFLKTDRGVKGMLELFSMVVEKYGHDITKLEEVLVALKSENYDFSSETAKGQYLGAGGPGLLAESFASHITRKIRGFSPSTYSIERDHATNERGEIADRKIQEWISTMEGDVRCHMPHIDDSTIKYLSYLSTEKVKRVRMFFAKCNKEDERKVKKGLVDLKKNGLNITVIQENKRTMHGGSIIHERFIGDDNYGFITDADLKDQSQKNTIMHLRLLEWRKPPELDTFDRYWDVAEKTRDIQFAYDWVSG